MCCYFQTNNKTECSSKYAGINIVFGYVDASTVCAYLLYNVLYFTRVIYTVYCIQCITNCWLLCNTSMNWQNSRLFVYFMAFWVKYIVFLCCVVYFKWLDSRSTILWQIGYIWTMGIYSYLVHLHISFFNSEI